MRFTSETQVVRTPDGGAVICNRSDEMPEKRPWLRATDDDGFQHVLYNPERARHRLTARCPCMPRIDCGVVIHETFSKDATGQDADRGN